MRRFSLAIVLFLGCSPSQPHLPESPHTPDELRVVPFPPPAARSDIVPARPHPDSVWIEGEWRWQGGRWVWRHGDWVVPPPGATLARSQTLREGTLVRHAVALFHLEGGGSIPPLELGERRNEGPVEACTSPPAAASLPVVATVAP